MEEKLKQGEKKIGQIEVWLRRHRPLYTGATRHPLIVSIRDGSIDMASFKKWLVKIIPFLFTFLSGLFDTPFFLVLLS